MILIYYIESTYILYFCLQVYSSESNVSDTSEGSSIIPNELITVEQETVVGELPKHTRYAYIHVYKAVCVYFNTYTIQCYSIKTTK